MLGSVFLEEWPEAASALEGALWEPARTVVVERDGEMAGTASAFTRRLAVPGGVVTAPHITMIGVLPPHRRRGVLRRMIDRLHLDAAERGEPVAVLWASEGKIYQRFGYGLATRTASLDASNVGLAFREDVPRGTGTVRSVPADSRERFQPVFDAVWTGRPGWSERDDNWWAKMLADTPEFRDGASAMRAEVYAEGDDVQGYLRWRARHKWTDNGPEGTVVVKELTARTPTAYRELWRFAFSVDLTRSVTMASIGVDDPLPFLVDEPRRLGLRVKDALWLRVLDVPAALAARRYAAPVEAVIEVPGYGTYEMSGDLDRAECRPTTRPADLTVTIGALGAAYLGGASLGTLADGGLVTEHTAGSLARASAAFRWARSPSTPDSF
jgi:predicted acetyltransferase